MPNVARVHKRMAESMFVDGEHCRRRFLERRRARRREQGDARADAIFAALDANVDRHSRLIAMHFEVRDFGRLLAERRVAHAERVPRAQIDVRRSGSQRREQRLTTFRLSTFEQQFVVTNKHEI